MCFLITFWIVCKSQMKEGMHQTRTFCISPGSLILEPGIEAYKVYPDLRLWTNMDSR